MLRTIAVEESTLVLLKKLQQIPLLSNLQLVGGTALALQIGHRFSIDLDLFGNIKVETGEIVEEMQKEGLNVKIEYDTKSIKRFLINNVQVDIVNYSYEWIGDIVEIDGLKLAGLKDIAAMKMNAITGRGTRKDFVDIYFLLQHFSLKNMFELFEQKYPEGISLNVFRSLGYFVDAESFPMPKMLVPVSWEEIKSTIKEAIVKF